MIVYPTGSTSSPTYKEYTVVKGDSLWAIAAKLLGSGTRYTEIVKLNNLKSTIIYTGQKLKIPN
ncbi:LysM peptidoglycan-binding domain-containing protein [Proteiniclasticum sp. C24MP]|uniref:LysM peptidoglycan-binding domain-containing protein n=1 Tax=Eubacteriales TaxID=186802 RepID=UPI0024ACB5BC|nr:LysM peptidoglycan-binding domain-containing protein [Petroclostridium sp. X23]WHH61608.1 LysM peptidoglycan-binding domain-containing protein [Petroclostridium sp. X23]